MKCYYEVALTILLSAGESPLMLANLSVGTHHLKIIPQGCGRQYRAYPFKFTIN